MKRFRIAHVITRLCKGGAQENTFHSVRLANRDRYEADLFSGPTFGDEGSIEDAVRAAGIEIVRVPHLVRRVAPISDLLALRELQRLFGMRRYDIVHTHTSKAGFLGRLAARRTGVPIVVHTPHGNIFDGYFNRWTTRLFIGMERYAARYADRIIELTPGGIEAHLERNIGRREQFEVVFSGIDLTPFDSARARRDETRRTLGFPADTFLVGAVGRLEPIKGFAYFVEAAHMVAERLPKAQFLVAGQGSLEQELRAISAPLGDRFRLLGPRSDVPAIMAALDVFVLASLNEGMGRVLLEAGAAGVASVASRVGGVPEIVEEGKTGLLVPPRDPKAIAGAICALAADDARRKAMGEAARAKIVPGYGIERMQEKIESLYEALIKEKQLDT